MGVSYDAPCLESVYKLVRYGGRAVVKLSVGKATLPGEKQVFRGPIGDVLGLRDEDLPGERLLGPAMRAGERTAEQEPLAAMRERFEGALSWLPEESKRIEAPVPRVPRVSDALSALAEEAKAEALHRTT
jgi:nicotinate phosphoribosyltransferase